jgi:hypothetical protein
MLVQTPFLRARPVEPVQLSTVNWGSMLTRSASTQGAPSIKFQIEARLVEPAQLNIMPQPVAANLGEAAAYKSGAG